MIGHPLRNCLGLLLGAGLATAASAQTLAVPDIQRQVDEAFKEVLAKAASTETRLRYASLLVKAGNFEGGIAAMEGLLVSPDAPASIRVELAVLYYRLGSYAMAENYLREALADSRLDAGLRKQAESLLADVVRRNQVSQLSGSVMLGVRSQSNPTTATGKDRIMSFGVSVPRNANVKARSDTDTQFWAKIDHSYDLGTQNEAAIVSSLVAFANHYALTNGYDSLAAGYARPYDVTVLAGTSGIRFKPSPSEHQNLTLMPHLIVGNTLLKGKQYFSVAGAGLEVSNRLADGMTIGGSYELRNFTFDSRSDIFDSQSQGGLEQALRVRGVVETGVNRFAMVELGYVDHDAKRDYFRYHGPEMKLAYVVSYASPLGGASNWTLILSGTAAQRSYRGPDPSITLANSRRDNEYRLSMINAIPVARDVSLQVQLDYTKASSNFSNYEYSNTAGTVGVMWKF